MNSRRSREIVFPGGTITGTIPFLIREWEGDAASKREVKANGRILPEKVSASQMASKDSFYGSQGNIRYSFCRRPELFATIYFEVIERPRAAPTAADTGVEDRVGAALRL